MRVLITGAAGFLGKRCSEVLAIRGHTVITTDRQGDVQALGDLSDSCFTARLPPADVVVHCAAVQYVSRDLPLISRKQYFLQNNVIATSRLCERYAGQKTHFVNVGTSMMYRQDGSPRYTTKSPMQGQGVYSSSKLAALRIAGALPNPLATVIPCIIGGIGREGLFRSFVSMMIKSSRVAFPGAGTHPTSMVHVDDVAMLIARVIESGAVGLFNAAAPVALSIDQWVSEIECELGLSPVRRIRIPLWPIRVASTLTGYRLLAREQLLMLAQPHVLAIDESLALGWQPRFNNAQIIRETARYIARHDP